MPQTLAGLRRQKEEVVMPEMIKEYAGGPILSDVELASLEMIQNRLATSLVKWAVENQLAAKDWAQGGWTRSGKDTIDLGFRLDGAPMEQR